MPTDIFKYYQTIANKYDNAKNLCLVFPTFKCKKKPTKTLFSRCIMMPCRGWGWVFSHILTNGIPFNARQKIIVKMQIMEMGS